MITAFSIGLEHNCRLDSHKRSIILFIWAVKELRNISVWVYKFTTFVFFQSNLAWLISIDTQVSNLWSFDSCRHRLKWKFWTSHFGFVTLEGGKTAKGIKKNIIKQNIKHEEYKNVPFNKQHIYHKIRTILTKFINSEAMN